MLCKPHQQRCQQRLQLCELASLRNNIHNAVLTSVTIQLGIRSRTR